MNQPAQRFRLWLDTTYTAGDWPFSEAWDVLAALPEKLPGGIDDFDVFLPDDHVNRTHGPLPRQAARVRTEVAVYRLEEAVVVVQRNWRGTPLAERFAPANPDNGQLILMADPARERALYVGYNERGEALVSVLDGLQPDDSHDPQRHLPGPDGVTVRTFAADAAWVAVCHIPVSAVPGVGGQSGELAFTAGRLWGETFEPSAWASPLNWAPVPDLMGRLILAPAAEGVPGLHRADLEYDPATETAGLVLSLDDGADPDLKITHNTAVSEHRAADGVLRLPILLDDGMNHLAVRVGKRRSVRFAFEKWSGHRLFPRPVPGAALPDEEQLRADFAAWHERQETKYVAPGTWGMAGRAGAQPGFDHHCAFPMEPYAWACLVLDRQPVYEARVRESCDRILAHIQPGGWVPCYHHGMEPEPFQGGAFGHGSASEALCLGYRVFGDQRYLDGARRTAEAYRLYALEYNTNYMAFVLWHLAELVELTGEASWLDVAAWYTEHGILRGLTPGGNFPGHNYYTAYGNITLKGMAKLWRVLPAEHALRPVLAEASTRFANQMLSRQLANGLFDGRNRLYFGYQHTLPGLYEYVRAAGPDAARQLQPVLAAMYAGQNASQRAAGTWERGGLDIALMARYLGELG